LIDNKRVSFALFLSPGSFDLSQMLVPVALSLLLLRDRGINVCLDVMHIWSIPFVVVGIVIDCGLVDRLRIVGVD